MMDGEEEFPDSEIFNLFSEIQGLAEIEHMFFEGLTPLVPVDSTPITLELEGWTTILHSILDGEELPSTSEVEESPRTLEVEEVPGTSEIEEPPRTLEVEEVPGTSEIEEPPRRKRGRRPKSETGPYTPAPRRRKPRKRKIHEIEQPFDDEVQEKKRLNAINAKKHRVEKKKEKQILEQQLEEVKKERDGFQKEIEMLREREVEFKKQLEYFKKQAYNLLSGLG